jgi:transcriptional regulator with XRE-family HTH domain
MSALGTFLREELRRRGQIPAEFAAESGIEKSTLSRLINGTVKMPDLSTFMVLSDRLGVPLSRLLELAGIPVEALTPAAAAEHLALLVESIPWLAPVVEDIVSLPEDDQNSVVSFVKFLVRRNQGNQDQTT